MHVKSELVIITGPTATGKTNFAAHLANKINAEIISADSRQVYRNMDIGTGKDIEDYMVNEKIIPYHLINIIDAGEKYNVYEFQKDFLNTYNLIKSRGSNVIVCGGTGMYIEAILKGYELISVPLNEKMREIWDQKTDDELANELSKVKSLHNISDTSNRKRLIRALEIANYYKENKKEIKPFPKFSYTIYGINFDRPQMRKRITQRLQSRLADGMVEEVSELLKSGIKPEILIYYGLEYKFITQYLLGELNYDEMFQKLNTAIHQFAKRQMTWFRRMERQGMKIHWLDGYASTEQKIERALSLLNSE